MPELQQHQIWAASAMYTTVHSSVGYLTHWAKSGIEPATSWFLVGFVSAAPRWGLPLPCFCLLFVVNMIINETHAHSKIQAVCKYTSFLLVDTLCLSLVLPISCISFQKFTWKPMCTHTHMHFMFVERNLFFNTKCTYAFTYLLYFCSSILEIFLYGYVSI